MLLVRSFGLVGQAGGEEGQQSQGGCPSVAGNIALAATRLVFALLGVVVQAPASIGGLVLGQPDEREGAGAFPAVGGFSCLRLAARPFQPRVDVQQFGRLGRFNVADVNFEFLGLLLFRLVLWPRLDVVCGHAGGRTVLDAGDQHDRRENEGCLTGHDSPPGTKGSISEIMSALRSVTRRVGQAPGHPLAGQRAPAHQSPSSVGRRSQTRWSHRTNRPESMIPRGEAIGNLWSAAAWPSATLQISAAAPGRRPARGPRSSGRRGGPRPGRSWRRSASEGRIAARSATC